MSDPKCVVIPFLFASAWTAALGRTELMSHAAVLAGRPVLGHARVSLASLSHSSFTACLAFGIFMAMGICRGVCIRSYPSIAKLPI